MATRRGTARDDKLDGTPTADVLLGLVGDDQLVFDAGEERVDGGEGSDRLVVMGDLDSSGRAGVSLFAPDRVSRPARITTR